MAGRMRKVTILKTTNPLSGTKRKESRFPDKPLFTITITLILSTHPGILPGTTLGMDFTDLEATGVAVFGQETTGVAMQDGVGAGVGDIPPSRTLPGVVTLYILGADGDTHRMALVGIMADIMVGTMAGTS